MLRACAAGRGVGSLAGAVSVYFLVFAQYSSSLLSVSVEFLAAAEANSYRIFVQKLQNKH